MIILSTKDRKPWDKQAWGGMRKAADDVLYKGKVIIMILMFMIMRCLFLGHPCSNPRSIGPIHLHATMIPVGSEGPACPVCPHRAHHLMTLRAFYALQDLVDL